MLTTILAIVLVASASVVQPVDTFLLTDKVFEKYRKATSNIVASADRIRKSLPRETKGRDNSSGDVIAAITAQCEEAGEFKKALAKAELTCREYALTNIVLMQASVLSFGVEREGEEFYTKRMPQASKTLRANVKFAMENKVAIEKVVADQRKAFR